MAQIVKKWDANNDGRVTMREFAEGLGSPDADMIVMEMGDDYEWWNNGSTIAWVVMSAHGHMDYGETLSGDEFKALLPDFGMDANDSPDLIMEYGSGNCFRPYDLSRFFDDWSRGTISIGGIPYWFDWDDARLYGDHRKDIKQWVLKYDKDGDGKTTYREFLEGIGAKDVDMILMELGSDRLWWMHGSDIQWPLTTTIDGYDQYSPLTRD